MIQKKHLLLAGYVLTISFLIAAIGSLIGLRIHSPTAWLIVVPVFLAIWAGFSWSTGWLRGYAIGLWTYKLAPKSPSFVRDMLTKIAAVFETVPARFATMVLFCVSLIVTIEIIAAISPAFVSAPGWWQMLLFAMLNCCAVGAGEAIYAKAKSKSAERA